MSDPQPTPAAMEARLQHLTEEERRQYSCADFLDHSIAPDNTRYLLRTINELRGKLLTAERDAVRDAVKRCCGVADDHDRRGNVAGEIRRAFADVLEDRE